MKAEGAINNKITVKWRQGNMEEGVTANVPVTDYSAIEKTLNASNVVKVIGYNAHYKPATMPTITQGTAGTVLKKQTFTLKRENKGSLILSFLMPIDLTKLSTVATTAKGKVLGGAKILSVIRNTKETY